MLLFFFFFVLNSHILQNKKRRERAKKKTNFKIFRIRVRMKELNLNDNLAFYLRKKTLTER